MCGRVCWRVGKVGCRGGDHIAVLAPEVAAYCSRVRVMALRTMVCLAGMPSACSDLNAE